MEQFQEYVRNSGCQGWLVYDFKRSNSIAHAALKIPKDEHLTRPFYYWVPSEGNPVLLVHHIERHILPHLPGKRICYLSFEERQEKLQLILEGVSSLFMEVSDKNQIPTLSQVCSGVVDQLRDWEIEILSSGNMLQQVINKLDEAQYASHCRAAKILQFAYEMAHQKIRDALSVDKIIYEGDIQELIAKELSDKGLIFEGMPSVAVGKNSANPHYHISNQGSQIEAHQVVLIDLWGREKHEGSVYADMTVMGYTGEDVPQKERDILSLVRRAQRCGIEGMKEAFKVLKPLTGAQVDRLCREVIEQEGLGQYFTHRTGHNIDEELHGLGTHLDSFETKDDRLIVPSTCCSVEPGIYLPGEFGVRLECDVYIHERGDVEITTPCQEEWICLL